MENDVFAAAVVTSLDTAFQTLATTFLAQHPEIRHEWRSVRDLLGGVRLDLVCAPGTDNEVFASLTGHQITVGSTHGDHEDFEQYGRNIPESQVAEKAFERFLALLVEAGHLSRTP